MHRVDHGGGWAPNGFPARLRFGHCGRCDDRCERGIPAARSKDFVRRVHWARFASSQTGMACIVFGELRACGMQAGVLKSGETEPAFDPTVDAKYMAWAFGRPTPT